jgi:hypothetical protein
MWSKIAAKKDDETTCENVPEETINVVEVPTRFDLEFKRDIKKFIRENYEMLTYIYNKCFKDYSHIDKKDFYIFAYYNSIK